jgi:pilus assembly protein CpaD
MNRSPFSAMASPSLCKLTARMLLVVGVAAVLGGCNYAAREIQAGYDYPNDYRLRHPIVIKEGDRTVELFVGRARGALTPTQRADIGAFATTWARESTGGIIIDVPVGTPNAHAANDATREIRSILSATGVPAQAVRVQNYQPRNPAALATIRLNYPKMTASVGPCGLWPHDMGASWGRHYNENVQYWNFACANQRNLAAMVENPADLVQPRGESSIYTARRSVVLDKFRKGESTATQYPAQDKGKISTVGQ